MTYMYEQLDSDHIGGRIKESSPGGGGLGAFVARTCNKNHCPKLSMTSKCTKANIKNVFVFSCPTPFYWYGLVGRKIIFFTSQIGYSLNIIVHSKTCLKRQLRKKKKNCLFYQDRLSHNACQKYCRMLPGTCI